MEPSTQPLRFGFLGGRECALLWRKASGDLVGVDLRPGDPIPSELTTVPPTIHPAGSFRRDVWDEAQGQWISCCDYTGVATYDKTSGALVRPLQLGEALPDSVTLQPPPRGTEGPFRWHDDDARWERVTADPDEPAADMQG
ncbi:hypothetical protein [Dyella sp. 2RAB6]|uniref:hypothetical protein n=1 Tax=Dyella sp. 2RAB6 TaxID=3232992 RepID=UPI003F8F51E5